MPVGYGLLTQSIRNHVNVQNKRAVTQIVTHSIIMENTVMGNVCDMKRSSEHNDSFLR